jgi:hypothetical protein
MVRLAIGHAAGRNRPQSLGATGPGRVRLAALSPSILWNGVPGSGFLNEPLDPVRTSAKPTCRLVTVPGQRFTDGHIVGVMAFASDDSTLVGGIDRVRFHFEGEARDVLEMSPRSFTRHDGSVYTCWAYWITLRKPADKTGTAHLYIESIPADATMQRRVLGPFAYGLENTLHDHLVEVAATPEEIPGFRYRTLEAAINYLKSVNARSPLVTVTETGTYLPAESGPAHVFPNWLTITAAADVTCTLARPSYIGDNASRFSFASENLCFRGVTFDMRYVSAVRNSNGSPFWIDRCIVTNSDPEGSFSKWRGQQRPIGFLFGGASFLTDCHISRLPNALGAGTALARGNLVIDGASDVAGDVMCMTGNIVRGWDSSAWLIGKNAFTVIYTGDQPTARLSAPSAQDSTRVLTATWGSNTATLTIGRTEEDFNGTTGNAYWPRHVVAWINSLGDGWSATLLDDTLCAFFVNIDRSDPEFSGGANGNASAMDVSVKGVAKTIKCNFDIHADGYQQRFGGVNQNVIICGEDWQVAGQLLFLSATEQDYDYTVVNNLFRFLFTAAEYIQPSSNLGRNPKNHVVIAHNTWVNQQLRIRYDSGVTLDQYCLIANNVIQSLVDVGTSTTQAGIILNNHLYAGATVPGGAAGTTIGGNVDSLFVNAAAGDFTPSGQLLVNGRAPVLAQDGKGRLRKAIDAVGALGTGGVSVSAFVAPPPKTNWNFNDFIPQVLGTGKAEVVSGTLARASRVNTANSGTLALSLAAGTYRVRCNLAEWTGNGTVHLRLRRGTLSAPTPITVDAGAGNYFAAGAVDATFTFTTPDNLLLGPSTDARSCQLTVGTAPLVEKIA